MSYPGGKAAAGVYQRLINLMPPHETYIEAFLGGGAVLLNKRPAPLNVGIDVDGAALRGVAGRLPVPCRTVTGGDGIRNASSSVAGLASIAGNDGCCPGNIDAADDCGRRWRLLHTDALAWLRGRTWTGRELVYLDPPYLMHTRSSSRRLYAFEPSMDGAGCDESWHVDLLALALGLPCMVMVSGYWSELYADLLAGWSSVAFTARDRAGNWHEERVWMNYPEPVALHDYAHLGENYRERERIKRKRLRWRRRLRAMDVLERRAILAELQGMGDG